MKMKIKTSKGIDIPAGGVAEFLKKAKKNDLNQNQREFGCKHRKEPKSGGEPFRRYCYEEKCTQHMKVVEIDGFCAECSLFDLDTHTLNIIGDALPKPSKTTDEVCERLGVGLSERRCNAVYLRGEKGYYSVMEIVKGLIDMVENVSCSCQNPEHNV